MHILGESFQATGHVLLEEGGRWGEKKERKKRGRGTAGMRERKKRRKKIYITG